MSASPEAAYAALLVSLAACSALFAADARATYASDDVSVAVARAAARDARAAYVATIDARDAAYIAYYGEGANDARDRDVRFRSSEIMTRIDRAAAARAAAARAAAGEVT